MAIAHRTSAALGTGTTSVTVSEPTGSAVGDVLLACIVDAATSGTTGTTAPTGWTFVVAAAGTGGRIQIFQALYRNLTGTSWTWTGLTTTSSGCIVGYSGVLEASWQDCATPTARRNASGTTGTTAITTQRNNAMCVAFFASLSNGATWSAEALASGPTITEFFDSNNGTAQSIAVADGIKATAGTTGLSSATMSANTNNAAALISLSPDIVGVMAAKEVDYALYAPPTGDLVAKEVDYALYAPPTGVLVAKEVDYVLYAWNNVNPPVWNITTMPNGIQFNPYSVTWNLAPAAPPTTYTVVAGALPTGLSLNNVGADVGSITGTPTVLGLFSFTLRATNLYGTADQAFTITIVAPVGPTVSHTFVM